MIYIGDRDVTGLPPKDRRHRDGRQNYALYPHLTVADDMGFGLKMQGVGKQERAERVLEAAKLLGLEDSLGRCVPLPSAEASGQVLLSRKPKALSGGQPQRVALGRPTPAATRRAGWPLIPGRQEECWMPGFCPPLLTWVLGSLAFAACIFPVIRRTLRPGLVPPPTVTPSGGRPSLAGQQPPPGGEVAANSDHMDDHADARSGDEGKHHHVG
jgi:hypothetical protein